MTCAPISPFPSARPTGISRVRAVLATAAAAVLGAAPHVLHHAGPLAGAALVAGATGTVLFGLLGFVLAVPMLRRMRRRTGSWAAPGGLLALMVAVFAFSAFVVGPGVTGSSGNESNSTPHGPAVTTPGPGPGHESHHQ